MTTFAPPLRCSALILAAAMCSTAARGQAPPAPVFDPPVTFTTIDIPFDLAATDVDLDGNIDLAVSAADGNSIWVYLNRGPTFWATTPTKGLKLIGIYDNTVCNIGTFTATEIPNLTFGHFEFAGYPRDAGPVQVLLANLNGDGYLDIITTNSRDDTISVLINSL